MSQLNQHNWQRSHTCGEVNASNNEQEIQLCGWVDSRRDHGGLIFIDLRDRYGIVQVVFQPGPEIFALASKLRSEYVISVRGQVRLRPDNMINPKIASGEIEVLATDFIILSEAQTPPFVIEDNTDATEGLRLKHRYLDLRRPQLQKYMSIRHEFYQIVRSFLNKHQFMEVETPILFKSTPEGSRDYLVPSRISKGEFYALPQSPQILKQLLMISGFDRYYQIARCFRDEDLRADRQPEFTHLDLEMSFVNQEMIFSLVEELQTEIYEKIKGHHLHTPFPRMTYADAMENYGSDKPDTRFQMLIQDVSSVFVSSEFKAFKSPLETGGAIRGIIVKEQEKGEKSFSRKDMDELTKLVTKYGAKGLAWFKVESASKVNSPVAKFLSEGEIQSLIQEFQANSGDIILLVADPNIETVANSLGALRLQLGKELKLIDEGAFNFLWITDFPLFEYSPEEKRFVARHHPFTSPKPEHEEMLLKGESLEHINAAAYDLVLNGHEIVGGSIRIHRQEVQNAMFKALKMDEAEVKAKFGFFIEALKYGTPPHGGCAFGLDRNIMILCGTEAIRDVIAFPKTLKALCLMSECPSKVEIEQLTELGIGVLQQKK